MKKHIFISGIISLLLNLSCENSKKESVSTNDDTVAIKPNLTEKSVSTTEIKNYPTDFVPKAYVVFDKIFGDLNKDGVEDCVLIIKGTDKSKFVNDEYQGVLDRNRRGIIVLFNKNGHYELATKNYDCFSSEHEEGGVYYAPELGFEIKKGNLYINYAHGRYGYWEYTFRYQNSDLELIGYDDSDNRGPVINSETSINYLTRTKIVNVNTNVNAESGEEVFKKSVSKISRTRLIKLSEIKNFDELLSDED
ncbi:hypothetical protein LUD75_13990 [Epilithonimonas sp. JDS]|uniref:hypothetical protein n=1 Tax=Epilithonimonas sp. JDS TaxID=2902797 RepID=UPI001E40F075|nr:hypothetical protein [Epilithonimonas sp. JDS]MCD9855831.1 hypothetical protein [Epilithonimonas sp. JDS]